MKLTANYWIRKLGLQRHPEGGWFREVYRASEAIPRRGLPARYPGPRACSTSIYFLLARSEFSAFHRLRSDEVWHFYAGSPVRLYLIGRDACLRTLRLGPLLARGQRFQALVPAGVWLAAEVAGRAAYALVGCTVAPGFEHADFELAQRENLCRRVPRHAALIRRLTRAIDAV
jgi:uncharacterized protein